MNASKWTLPALACLAVVFARIRSAPGVDVSVLITWAERTVDGARPFIDFIEVNPPGSVLLYVPAVVFARATGLSPEVASEILQCALIALSLTLSWRVLDRAGLLERHDPHKLLAAAIAIIGVMPAVAFGQREHVGIISALPILAVTAAEIAGRRPTRWLGLAAGMLAGLSVIAKPHFALIYIAVVASGIVATRTLWLAVRIQWIAAGLTLATYVGLTYWAYPTFYTTHLPKIAEVYLGWRVGPASMAANPVPLIFAIALIMLRRRHLTNRIDPPALLLALSALVGAAVFFLQARGWPYHALPAISLIALAMAWEATRKAETLVPADNQSRATNAIQPRHMIAGLALIVAANFVWSDKDHNRSTGRIAAAVTQAHPHPRLLAIAEDISVGHPLVRQVKGTWTHNVTHLWTAFGIYMQGAKGRDIEPEKRARLLAYLRSEMADLAASIEREKPDIILAQRGLRKDKDFDWLEWARSWPALAGQLAQYSTVTQIDDVEILKRNVIADRSRQTAAAQPATSRVP